jgi:hypothetical protein
VNHQRQQQPSSSPSQTGEDLASSPEWKLKSNNQNNSSNNNTSHSSVPTASLTSGSRSGAPGSSDSWGKDVSTTKTQQQQQEKQRLTHSKHPRTPDLVEHLKAISISTAAAQAVPKTIFLSGYSNSSNSNDDKDFQSLVSKLTLPEEQQLVLFRKQRQRQRHHQRQRQEKRDAQQQRIVVVVSSEDDDDDDTDTTAAHARTRGLPITLTIGGQVENGRYSGELDDQGCPSGQGMIKFHNNDLYIGEIGEQGKMHGKGTLLFSKDAVVLRGEFQENLFVV